MRGGSQVETPQGSTFTPKLTVTATDWSHVARAGAVQRVPTWREDSEHWVEYYRGPGD
jgi:hypothetical protein